MTTTPESGADGVWIPDPFDGLDIASIALGVVCYVANISVFILLLLKKRTFIPFRTRNIKVLFILQISGFIYWLGQLIGLETKALAYSRASCIILNVWLMYSAGLLFYLVVVNYRMWILYWLLVRMQPIGGRYFYGIFASMCLLPMIFPILSTAIPGWVYTTNGDQPGTCMYSPGYSVLFCVALYYLTVVAIVLAILLRNVRKSFNEYLETMTSTAGFTVLVIVMGVTGMKVVWLHSWGRFIMLNLSLIAVNLYFWASLARPLYGYLFDRQNYLARFQETLAMDGLAEFKSSSGTASRADNGTTLKGSVTETMTPMEEDVVVAMPGKKDVVYPASVSDAELTDVRSLFAPTKPMDEKSYLV